MSYFNTAPKTGSLRAQELDLHYHLKQCEAMFGKKMFPTSLKMIANYGGEFPKAENVRNPVYSILLLCWCFF